MNILVVLAVAAVFGLLRFRRANLLMWAGAWWVGIYVLLRFGFTAPIPSSVVSIYMGVNMYSSGVMLPHMRLIRFLRQRRHSDNPNVTSDIGEPTPPPKMA